MKKIGEEQEPWMLTFGDITTLLLCFFVMIFASSSFRGEIFKEYTKSITESLKTAWKEKPKKEELIMKKLERSVDFTLEERSALVEAIHSIMELKDRMGGINVEVTDLGLVVKAESPILFKIAKADLREEAIPLLEGIIKIYNAKNCDISVYGHTCDLPIHTEEFQSNWELSCARALSVVKFFIKNNIKGENLSATGCADQYPVAPNTNEENRKLNRRVEIFLDFRTKKL